MFKSLFSKYITAFTAIIAVSFLILVLAMSSLVSNYSIETKKTLMDSSARYTSEIIDTYRVFDNTGFSGTVEKYASRIRDALEEYAEYYAPYRPNYSGDTGYTGDYEHGGSYGDTIDTSGFVSPSTKNNVDLAAYAMQAWENNWGYCWGTYGNVLTEALFNYKLQQYPEGVGKYEDFIRANWLGRRTADCIGLIKGYGWLDAASGSINYGTNGMPDVGADQMYANAQRAGMAGTMDTIPEVVGIALWKQGHIGVYVGNGYAVEAMGTKYGVVRTEVAGRGWQGWCRIPYIEYREAG